MATDSASDGIDDSDWSEFVEPGRDEPTFDVPGVVAGICLGGLFPEGEVPEDDNDPAFELSPSWVLDWVAGEPAGPTSMTLLAGLTTQLLNPYERVLLMQQWDRQVAHCEAMKLTAMKAVVDDDENLAEFVSHEIAAALHLTRPAADRLVQLCRRLGRTLPKTARALADGLISQGHATVLSEETAILTPAVAGQVESMLLPSAGSKTVGQLRYAARKLIGVLDPDALAARHKRRRKQNDVTVSDQGDGLSGIWAMLDPPDAAIVKTAVDTWALTRKTRLPDLTVGQRRTQALVEWAKAYLAGPDTPTPHGRPVSVDLVIDLPTLLGLAEHPGEIVGYGIIPADLARRLAADGQWRRLVTDPLTGHLLDCGRHPLPTDPTAEELPARPRESFGLSRIRNPLRALRHRPRQPLPARRHRPRQPRTPRPPRPPSQNQRRLDGETHRRRHQPMAKPHRTHLPNRTPRLPIWSLAGWG